MLCYTIIISILPMSENLVMFSQHIVPFGFGMPGPAEWLVILIIILLIVGPKKLPELMRSLGKSVNSFKRGMKEMDTDNDSPDEKHPPKTDNQNPS